MSIIHIYTDGSSRGNPGPGGFGFSDVGPHGLGVRVDGAELVIARDGEVARAPLTTLAAAAEQVGVEVHAERSREFDVPEAGDPAAPLDIDPVAASALADWFTFSADILGARNAGATDPSDIVLWPEHFDCAFDEGSQDLGTRGTYGASPGDARTWEPYLYVLPWRGAMGDPFWNATGFEGAVLHYRDLGPDPHVRALQFFEMARTYLIGGV